MPSVVVSLLFLPLLKQKRGAENLSRPPSLNSLFLISAAKTPHNPVLYITGNAPFPHSPPAKASLASNSDPSPNPRKTGHSPQYPLPQIYSPQTPRHTLPASTSVRRFAA